jgi:hypothetical protein
VEVDKLCFAMRERRLEAKIFIEWCMRSNHPASIQRRHQAGVEIAGFMDGEDGPWLRGTMAKLTSFQTDIRPLFTERDIHAMSKAFNLGSYEDVKAHAAIIYDRIRGIGGAVMPPPPPKGEGPWPQSRIELFAKWISDGYQP